MARGSGRLRSSINRWASHTNEHARQLRATSAEAGCCPIAEVQDRGFVELEGVLRTVTLRPRGGVPALEAELYDGSDVITVIWLGRRRIAGIEPGRAMRVEARVGHQNGHRVMFNPRYELRA
ncbi:MAG: FIG00821051: hypothetical protein [uncultured Nocardioidaceae bacterium]|uniref:DNA-binding protein n=1 Tax=uncultured Nocardioidaceae bacterium TaxID=253824 RepID=A0A6J4M263_9ACTN|nr:MAG: FIG00821051: hypothetical protein [uncultured Nocardioidaceae bacterium]